MYNLELRSRRPHQHWEKELDKFFDVFSKTDNFAPACEINDEEKFFTISIDVPGLKQEDLDIEVKDNHLYVTGERKSVRENVLRTEKKYGKFSRIFSLPQNVNTDAIEARFQDGVLELTVPKEEKSQAKKITVSNWKKADSDLKN